MQCKRQFARSGQLRAKTRTPGNSNCESTSLCSTVNSNISRVFEYSIGYSTGYLNNKKARFAQPYDRNTHHDVIYDAQSKHNSAKVGNEEVFCLQKLKLCLLNSGFVVRAYDGSVGVRRLLSNYAPRRSAVSI